MLNGPSNACSFPLLLQFFIQRGSGILYNKERRFLNKRVRDLMDFSNKHMMEFEASSLLSQLIEYTCLAQGIELDDRRSENTTRDDEAHNELPWMIHA
jgi:hypothetical protein